MTGKAEIQYIRFNVIDGNAARKIEVAPPIEFAPLTVKKCRRKRIYVDPIAILGTLVAVVMFASMAVGVVRYQNRCERIAVMQSYVSALQAENAELKETYHSSYDLAEVERTALALGMIPREEAENIDLSLGE